VKDLRRLRLVRFFRVRRRFFAISKPPERRSIGIYIQGRLGNGGEAKAVLEYDGDELFESLLVIDAVCELSLTYNCERQIDEDSVLGW
jgi:hypothetical protein